MQIVVIRGGLLLLLFITEFARGAFYFTFLPFYTVNSLGFPITVAGFAISAHYLTETLCKMIAGWQFDRFGRPVLFSGLLLCLISFLLIKAWPVPLILVLGAGLFGMGFSPVWLGVISRVAPVDVSNRASRISLVFATWLAGAGSGMIGVNFIMSKDYELVFRLVIILWTISLFIAWFSTSGGATTVSKTKAYSVLAALQYMAANKAIIKVLVPGMFLQTLAAGLLLPVIPLFVQQQLGLNHDQYGLLLLAGGVSAVVSLLPMGYLANRFALKFLLATGFGLCSLFLGILAASKGPEYSFPLAILMGLSYAMVLPAWNSLLAQIIPRERQAFAWGVFATVEGLGITIGPVLGSVVARWVGISVTLVVTVGILLSASVFYFAYPLEKSLAR